MKDLDRNGVWFFPENPDQQYFGKVTFSSSIGAELELYGLGGQPVSKAFVKVIHGYIEGETGENSLVSLFECKQTQDYFPTQGIPKTKFYATYLFQGKHYNAIEEVKFSKVLVDYNHLDSWINIPNFRRELTNDNQTINVTQIVKGSQELGKLLNFSISIVFFPSGMYRDLYKIVDNDQDSILIEDHKSILIGDHKSILIESDAGELSSFNDFLDVINNFKDFLTFACNQVFIVTRVRFFVKIELDQPEVDPIQWEQLFQYFVSGDLVAYDKATNCRKELAYKTTEVNLYTLTNSQNINEKFNGRNVLFYYSNIDNNFIINKWDEVTSSDKFKYIIEIYVYLFYIPTHHYRTLFLNLAQAIEAFHRKNMVKKHIVIKTPLTK